MENLQNDLNAKMDEVGVEEIKAKVREELPDYPWPDVYMDSLWHGVHGAEKPVEGFLGIFMDYTDQKTKERVTGKPLNVCTEQYLLVPHEIVYHKFHTALMENNIEYGDPKIGLKFFDEGAKFEMTARFPDTKIKIGKDEVSPEVGIKNSNDMAWQQSAYGGAFVWRCSNGQYAGHLAFEWKKKHRLNYSVEAQVQELIHGMGSMSNQFDVWKTWSKKQLDSSQCVKLFESLPISEKQAEKLLELPEIGTSLRLKDSFDAGKTVSAWDINSIVTQWLTHDVAESAGRRDREEKVAVVMDRFLKKV